MILSQTLSIANKSNENGNLGHLGNQDSNKNNQILLEYPRFKSVVFRDGDNFCKAFVMCGMCFSYTVFPHIVSAETILF